MPTESVARKLAPVAVIFPLNCLYTIASESGGADIQSLRLKSHYYAAFFNQICRRLVFVLEPTNANNSNDNESFEGRSLCR